MFHQIGWNLNTHCFMYGILTTFLSIAFPILILEWRYRYFWILQRLGCWKMYRTSFQDVSEANKWAKQKSVLFFETPCIMITTAWFLNTQPISPPVHMYMTTLASNSLLYTPCFLHLGWTTSLTLCTTASTKS